MASNETKGPEKKRRDYGKNDFSDIPDDWELPKGNVERGKKLFKKHCAQCHSIYPDGRRMHGMSGVGVGPTMFQVCNRTAGETSAGKRDLMGYIKATSSTHPTIVWTDAELMNYMKNPRAALEGTPTSMNFNGITAIQPRVDIIHFLHTLEYDNPEITNQPKIKEGFLFSRVWRRLTGDHDDHSEKPWQFTR